MYIYDYVVTSSGEIEEDDEYSQNEPTMKMEIHRHGHGYRTNGGS